MTRGGIFYNCKRKMFYKKSFCRLSARSKAPSVLLSVAEMRQRLEKIQVFSTDNASAVFPSITIITSTMNTKHLNCHKSVIKIFFLATQFAEHGFMRPCE